MKTIGVIGGGNMGGAIIAGICQSYKTYVCEKDRQRAAFLKRKYRVGLRDIREIAQTCDVVILAVKPQDIDASLQMIQGVLRKDALIISVAAGITTQYLEQALLHGVKVVRVMPNMPAQVGEGITGVAPGHDARRKDTECACRIFQSVGKTVVINEDMMDALTAVSGSGPAYVFLFAECMIKAAKALGFSDCLAQTLVYQTLSGSVCQLLASPDDVAVLRKRVTSKGGTTEAALKVFQQAKIEKIFHNALKAAEKRSKALARSRR